MDYMARALELARRALGKVSPNPAVGAVIVKGGQIVGEGYTQPPGQDHAEIVALKQAGEEAKDATMYVTLEPCCFFGRTPPCTQAIIESGIREVHLAMLDPNPRVSGQGRAQLESAGIRTYLGEHEEEARELNEAYIKFITTGLPFVIAKFAMSLDGKIATRTFDSKWISSEKSREWAHRLRGIVDAVMVGVNTVIQDDPELAAGPGAPRQPLRIVVDSRGHTPLTAKILRRPGRTLLATTSSIELPKANQYTEAGAEVLLLPPRDGLVDLPALLKELGEREVTSVLVEGGGTLLGSLFDLRLVDKVLAFISPIIIGGREAISPVGGRGVARVEGALRLRRVRLERFGEDVLISGYCEWK